MCLGFYMLRKSSGECIRKIGACLYKAFGISINTPKATSDNAVLFNNTSFTFDPARYGPMKVPSRLYGGDKF